MQRQAQGHDVGIVLAEFQGRSVLGQGVQIHAEKIYRELTVDVVKFIFIFPVSLLSGLPCLLSSGYGDSKGISGLTHLWIMKCLRSFFGDEGMPAVRAQQHGRGAVTRSPEENVCPHTFCTDIWPLPPLLS